MKILDNQSFMILEWIVGEERKGVDLRSWMRYSPLKLRQAFEITMDILYGLIHAQEKQPGIVHRDLKPENILIAQGGVAKITDFGLAGIAESASSSFYEFEVEGQHNLVRKRDVAGTPEYMAPEQWRGEYFDERTNIYAIGCIFYEMITGKCPFQGTFVPNTPQLFEFWLNEMQTQHETQDPPALPQYLPITLRDLLRRCLAKEITERPASLSNLLNSLNLLYHQHFDKVPPARPSPGEFKAFDYNNRALTFYTLQQTEAALEDLTRAIKLDPTYALAFHNRGIVFSNLQSTQAAIEDFTKALEINPSYAPAYYNRGVNRSKKHETAQALDDFTRSIELDPNFAPAYYNRGLLYWTLNQHEQSITDYSYAIQIDPNYSRAYLQRAITYTELSQYEPALSDYSRAMELDPHNAFVYFSQGVIHTILKQYKLALNSFTQAIDLDPNYGTAYFNRCLVYQELKQLELAVIDFNQARMLGFNQDDERGRKLAESFLDRGKYYVDSQQYELALNDFSQAIFLNPQYAKAFYNRGTTYAILEQYAAALPDFGQAIRFNPQFTEAYFNYGAILVNTGQPHESLPYFEKADQLGHLQAVQTIAQVRQMLTEIPVPTADPNQQAFYAFQQVDSLAAMSQAVAQYPLLVDEAFIDAVRQAINQQVPPEHRPAFEKRLAWLRKIAQQYSR